jgi:hypothetical protein
MRQLPVPYLATAVVREEIRRYALSEEEVAEEVKELFRMISGG